MDENDRFVPFDIEFQDTFLIHIFILKRWEF